MLKSRYALYRYIEMGRKTCLREKRHKIPT